VQPEHLNLPG